jgi:hypothetical protein
MAEERLAFQSPPYALHTPSSARFARMKVAEQSRLLEAAQAQQDRLLRIAMYTHLFGGRYVEYSLHIHARLPSRRNQLSGGGDKWGNSFSLLNAM